MSSVFGKRIKNEDDYMGSLNSNPNELAYGYL